MAFSGPHIILSRGPGTEAVRASQTHRSPRRIRQHGISKADHRFCLSGFQLCSQAMQAVEVVNRWHVEAAWTTGSFLWSPTPPNLPRAQGISPETGWQGCGLASTKRVKLLGLKQRKSGRGCKNTHNQKWLLIRDNKRSCFSLEKQPWNQWFCGIFLASTADVWSMWDRSTDSLGRTRQQDALRWELPVVAEADQSLNNFRVIWWVKAPMWR